MFKIVQVLDTDYPTSDDREELQTTADELNRDAIASGTSERWIIVQTTIWQSLQEVEVKS
jgi:hypothetical protein